MKILKLFAFVGVFAILFAGCEKEDDFSIVGSWNVNTLKIMMGTEVISESPAAGTLVFNADKTGNYALVGEYGNGEFSWNLTGDNLQITGIDPYIDGTFRLTNKKATSVVLLRTFGDLEVRIELSTN